MTSFLFRALSGLSLLRHEVSIRGHFCMSQGLGRLARRLARWNKCVRCRLNSFKVSEPWSWILRETVIYAGRIAFPDLAIILLLGSLLGF